MDALERHLPSTHSDAAEEARSSIVPTPCPGTSTTPSRGQRPLRPFCTRYCKCQCHRISVVRIPVWAEWIIESMSLKYNSGVARLVSNACNITGYLSQSNQMLSLVYALPRGLLGRSVAISASWGPINLRASLHLTMPTLHSTRLYDPLYELDPDRLKRGVSAKEIIPTFVGRFGQGYLLVRPPI